MFNIYIYIYFFSISRRGACKKRLSNCPNCPKSFSPRWSVNKHSMEHRPT